MDDLAIGIDLGTTNSCAACYINGKLEVLGTAEGNRITPSVTYFTEKNAAIVGEYAKKMTTAKPEYGVFEIKRLVGRKYDDPYVQNNLKYFPFKLDNDSRDPIVLIEQPKQTIRKTPVEICTTILSKIRMDAQSKLGHHICKAVITVPAYFNVTQREATLAAANGAGFTVLKLLNEPTAAALSYYLENDCEEESYSLVYDLGGGTFDVAILKRSRRNIDIKCVDGDSHLGGQDFDNLIIDYVCDELMKKYRYSPKEDRRAMRRLHGVCEEAKKTLSVAEETTIPLHGFVKNVGTVELPLTREQFEKMTEKLFQKTISIVDNCLRTCNLSKSAIKEVILSGGSTRIPKIQKMLSNFFNGKNLNKFVNPDECVAEGAALQAAMLSHNTIQQITAIRISDVTPLSLGLRNFVDLMTFLIKRNTKIPASESSNRVTVYNQQKSMAFDIYEGERLNAKKNHCIGKMVIDDITLAPPGQCEVIFTMTLDQNGILTVSAKEKYKNNFKDLTVTYTRGHRSDSEVKNALKDADDHRDEDKAFERFAKQKEFLLDYCIRAMYNFENKNLVERYEDSYSLCKKFKIRGEKMDVGDEEQVKKMTQEVKRSCQSIVDKHQFNFMPLGT